MKITYNPDGSISFGSDMKDVSSLIEFLSGGLVENKEKAFLNTLDFMSNKRPLLGQIAKVYYEYVNRHNKIKLLHQQIPLLVSDQCFDGELYDIADIKCTYDRNFSEIKRKDVDLPTKNKNYVQNIIDHKYNGSEENSPFNNRFCYRIVNVISPKDIQFEYCYYFDYINTCEYQFYLFAKDVIRHIKKISDNSFNVSKLKREINPFDFTNRYLVPGINTLLIFWDKSNPIMYIHKRSKKTVAEAINVKHIVPAGTFQPIHMDDGNHGVDFSFYTNIMREFGEELTGDKELVHPKGILEDVIKRPSLVPIDHLIRIGRGKIYYAGLTFDCLTLKPEILSIMVLFREDYEKFIGPINFTESFEGDPFAVKFDKPTLEQYVLDPEMLPAGAGCLFMASENYDRIASEMRTT
ncbi:MAG: hypothetical protein EPN25_07440 [Nitrospirae bacterium]|nr:MAG: hypothetical protein EPN25_07440 [Nitrospirota bacterium]